MNFVDFKCAAGIVLYNPNIIRLQKNMDSIVEQVQKVYLFDNGSENIIEIEELTNKYRSVELIKSKVNKGIAYALNALTECAENNGFNWIITLDQDSVTQKNTIKIYSKYVAQDDIAIISPYAIDRRKKNIEHIIPNEKFSYIDYAITSGSMVNISIGKKIGLYDDWLFIGLVDTDFCKRIKLYGYKILRSNEVILDQEFGNLTPSKNEQFYLMLGEKLHSEQIKKLSYHREVNLLRVYYSTRNILYLTKKYNNYCNKYKEYYSLLKGSIATVLRAENKSKIIIAMYQGVRDGLKSNVLPIQINKNRY